MLTPHTYVWVSLSFYGLIFFSQKFELNINEVSILYEVNKKDAFGQNISQYILNSLLSLISTWRLTLTTSRYWHLLPASWRQRRGWTNSAILCWGGQMESNWALLPRNPAWHCSLRTPTSHQPSSPRLCQRASRALNVIKKTLSGSNWGFTTETLVGTCKAFVRHHP